MDKTRTKAYVSILLVIAVVLLTLFVGMGSHPSTDYSSGIAIDFENRDVVWTNIEKNNLNDPLEALKSACDANGYTYTIDGSEVTEVNGISNDTDCKWGLWTISKGELSWSKNDVSIDVKDYEVAAWAYRSDDSAPTIGVDRTGTSIYGYPVPSRTITIAPSVTETLCSAGASNTIVGTDQYSNYPDKIAERQSTGEIAIIGGYTNPSYEMIVKCDPDMVFCYGGQQSHVELAEKLRKASTNVVVLYEGEDVDTLYDNIYICGVTTGNTAVADNTIGDLQNAVDEITDVLESSMSITDTPTMIALSAVKSPWVSGHQTYVSDILSNVHGDNVYDIEYGWVQINSETIALKNPSVIIILTTDYAATQEAYDTMISSLSAEWKSTDAYKNDQIYLFTETLGDLSQRPGPRMAQLTEIIARTLHGESFKDGIEIPNFLGDNYEDYLTFTKGLNYNE